MTHDDSHAPQRTTVPPDSATPASTTDDLASLLQSPAIRGVLALMTGLVAAALVVGNRHMALATLGENSGTATAAIGATLVGLLIGIVTGNFVRSSLSPERLLCAAFCMAGLACLALPTWNLSLGDRDFFWQLSPMLRSIVHAALVFVIPAIPIGTLVPIIGRSGGSQATAMGAQVMRFAGFFVGGTAGVMLFGDRVLPVLGAEAMIAVGGLLLSGTALLLVPDWNLTRAAAITNGLAALCAIGPGASLESLGRVLALRPIPLQQTRGDIIDTADARWVIEDDVTDQTNALRANRDVRCMLKLSDPLNLGLPHQRMRAAIAASVRKESAVNELVIGTALDYIAHTLVAVEKADIHLCDVPPKVLDLTATWLKFPAADPRLHQVAVGGRARLNDLIRDKFAGTAVPTMDFIHIELYGERQPTADLLTTDAAELCHQLGGSDGMCLISLCDAAGDQSHLAPAAAASYRKVYKSVALFAVSRPRGDIQSYLIVATDRDMDWSSLLKSQGVQPFYAARQIDFAKAQPVADGDMGSYATMATEAWQSARLPLIEELLRRAWSAHIARDREARERFAREAFEQEQTVEAGLLLGIVHMDRQELSEAVALYSKLIALYPDNADLIAAYVFALNAAGRQAEAVEVAERGIAERPDSWMLELRLAESLRALGRNNDAMAHLTRSLSINNTYAGTWVAIGNTAIELSRIDDAEFAFHKAVEIGHESADVHSGLGLVALERGDTRVAMGHLRKALEFDPDHAQTFYRLGMAFRLMGDDTRAMGAYQKALALRPDWNDARFNLATTFLALGMPKEAMAEYVVIVRNDPKYAKAYAALAMVQRESEMSADARKTLELGLERMPDSADIKIEMISLLAMNVLKTERDGARAAKLAAEVLQTMPDDPRACYVSAAAFAEAGEFNRAVETAQHARELTEKAENAPFTEELDRCLKLYSAQKNFERIEVAATLPSDMPATAPAVPHTDESAATTPTTP